MKISRTYWSPLHDCWHLFLMATITTFLTTCLQAADYPLTPRLVGDWWTVAGDPDLGPLTNPGQQVVDFGIWQAVDGSWQIWSCIRNTKETGKSRLFHRWEGAKLTDPNWTPKGIALRADPALGETPGGLQAPYVLRHQEQYYMFYGDWANICLATSTDGKTFTRYRNAQGKPQLNFTGPVDRNRNGRDPMVRRIDGQWYMAALLPTLKGIRVARLEWRPRTRASEKLRIIIETDAGGFQQKLAPFQLIAGTLLMSEEIFKHNLGGDLEV